MVLGMAVALAGERLASTQLHVMTLQEKICQWEARLPIGEGGLSSSGRTSFAAL